MARPDLRTARHHHDDESGADETGVVLTSLAGVFGELAGALSDPLTQQAAGAVLGAYAS